MKRTVLLFFAFFVNFLFVQAQQLTRLKNVPYFNPSLSVEGMFFDVFDTGQNSPLSEIGCDVFKTKYIILSNKDRGFVSTSLILETGKPNHNVFCSDILPDYSLGLPLLFSKILNSPLDQSSLTFMPKEDAIYFTKSVEGKPKQYVLMHAKLDAKEKYFWKDIKELKINSPEYSIETPYVGSKENIIYLSSNKPGGYGGFDLYQASIGKDGEVSDLVNLGPEINTASDEKYPFIDEASRYFYFSSNKPGGYGGFDVYRSSVVEKSFVNIQNMGNTLNTNVNDVAFYLHKDNSGYITTNEPLDADDYNIYKFRMMDLDQTIEVKVFDEDDKKPMGNAIVSMKNEFGEEVGVGLTNNDGIAKITGGLMNQYRVYVTKESYIPNRVSISTPNNKEGKNVHQVEIPIKKYPLIGTVVDIDSRKLLADLPVVILTKDKKVFLETTTNLAGEFYVKDLPETDFTIQIKQYGYQENKIKFNRSSITQGSPVYKTIEMVSDEIKVVNKKLVIENIYFDFDKATIKKESFPTLMKIVSYMNAELDINLKISTHTDSKGTDAYNIKLSENRAISVFNYLIGKGISKERLAYEFFGESVPSINCGDKCTPKEDALNRRVEFIIVD